MNTYYLFKKNDCVGILKTNIYTFVHLSNVGKHKVSQNFGYSRVPTCVGGKNKRF